jgi:hypothetical protein
VAVAGALLLSTASPALAGKSSSSSGSSEPLQCEVQLFSQPFLFVNDSNNYVLVPGETPGNFNGTGWTLSGGARVVRSTLADGSTGGVLELPGGSQAVTPTFCVTNEYPTARAMMQSVVGAQGIYFYVSYEGTATWTSPKNTGSIKGATSEFVPTGSVNMQPLNIGGWQRVRVTLVPGGNSLSLYRLYNLYIDPYRR